MIVYRLVFFLIGIYLLTFLLFFIASCLYTKTMRMFDTKINFSKMSKVETLGFGMFGSHMVGVVIGLVVLGLFFYFLGFILVIGWLIENEGASILIGTIILLLPLISQISILKILSNRMQRKTLSDLWKKEPK